MLKTILIAKHITLFILPYIFLYAIYIQFNGETSPGGGFQAGVIFASSLIAFDLIYGEHLLLKYFPIEILIFIATFGVIIYAGLGAVSLLCDDNYLNYYSLASDRLLAQSIGIFVAEIGVGLTVASIMCLIYSILDKELSNKNKVTKLRD